MEPTKHSLRNDSRPRRTILVVGGLLLIWPLLRFLSHRLPRKPKIVEVSGTLQNDRFLTREEFVLFSDGDQLWALSRTCTHLGCRLNFLDLEGYLECPCHQSRFAITGEVLRGPAVNPLRRYPVERTAAPSTFLVTIT